MKSTIASIIIAAIIIGGAFWLSGKGGEASTGVINSTEVVGDTQYIDILARGGYTPSTISAKASMPLVIRMKTQTTFDCSASVVIPSINYRVNLKPDNTTEINVPPQASGTTLRGSCAMGMYGFAINFE